MVSNGECIKILTEHSDHVSSVVFSGDGKYLVSGSGDNIIGLWKVSSGECIKTFTGHSNSVYSVVFSIDVKYLA